MVYVIGSDDSIRVPKTHVEVILAPHAFAQGNHIAHFRFAVLGIRDVVNGNIRRSKRYKIIYRQLWKQYMQLSLFQVVNFFKDKGDFFAKLSLSNIC